jgi:hypothetical protein
VLAGGALAAIAPLAIGWLAPRMPRPRVVSYAAGGALAACAIAVLSIGSSRYLVRHSLVRVEWDATPAAFLSSRPGFDSGHQPVATAPVALGPEAGDRLTHRSTVVGESEPCARVRARVTAGWVVVRLVDPQPIPGHPGLVFPPRGTAQSCLEALKPQFDDGAYRIYGPA